MQLWEVNMMQVVLQRCITYMLLVECMILVVLLLNVQEWYFKHHLAQGLLLQELT